MFCVTHSHHPSHIFIYVHCLKQYGSSLKLWCSVCLYNFSSTCPFYMNKSVTFKFGGQVTFCMCVDCSNDVCLPTILFSFSTRDTRETKVKVIGLCFSGSITGNCRHELHEPSECIEDLLIIILCVSYQ